MSFSTKDCSTLTDASVNIVAEHKLLPAHPCTTTEVLLGPLDCLVAPQVPVAVLYLYERPQHCNTEDFLPFSRVKAAVEVTLDTYPQLAGRLEVNDATGDRRIVALSQGALMLEATCTQELSSFKAPTGERSDLPSYRLLHLPAGGNAFFAPFSPVMADVLANPVMTIQHTRFACGSVALGIRILHTLADAAAFAQWVQDLAQVYRRIGVSEGGAVLPAIPLEPTGAEHPFAMDWGETLRSDPETREAVIRKRPPRMYLAGDTEAEAAHKRLHDALGLPFPAPLPAVTVGKVLHFTAEELATMKKDFAAEASETCPRELTSFQALSGLLYSCVNRAKSEVLSRSGEDKSGAKPPTTFLTSVNIRGLMASNSASTSMRADRYFGNGVCAPFTEFPEAVAVNGNASAAAECIRRFLKEGFPSDPEAVIQMIQWVCAQPNKNDIRTSFVLGGFMVSAWNNFDLYGGATFDGHRPVLVTTPFTPISLVDVLGYYLPLTDRAGERGVTVYLAAGEEVWKVLERMPEIVQHVLE